MSDLPERLEFWESVDRTDPCGSDGLIPGKSLHSVTAIANAPRERQQVPPWPHPLEDSLEVRQNVLLHRRYLLQCEGDRVVMFLGLETGELLWMRSVAPRFGPTVSSIWFRRLNLEYHQRILQGVDSSSTDFSWSTNASSRSSDSPHQPSRSERSDGEPNQPRISMIQGPALCQVMSGPTSTIGQP